MFIIKLPIEYSQVERVEKPFKELSLAYKIDIAIELSQPEVHEGSKKYIGLNQIDQLVEELTGYYGEHYNCSCAR
ncbi:MAG: hypothetical protein OCD76_02985 [Reichenbachiella sp.]